MKSLLLALALALTVTALHAAPLVGNTITANGTYTISTYVGKRYVFAVSGVFGGGSLAFNWNNGSSTAYAGSPATVATTFSFIAAASVAEFVLSGATSPSLIVAVAIADGGGGGGEISGITGLQTALDGKIATTSLSTTGGAGKVLQADANGAWRLGPVANDNAIGDALGGLFMSDKRRIRFEDQAGNYDASIFNWGDHNGTENELIVDSTGRIALIPYRGMQFGPNDSQRYQRYIQMVSGNAGNSLGADENLMPSGALMMQTKSWNAGSPSENTIAMQGISLGGTNSLVRFTDGAAMLTNRTGIPTATVGDISGTAIAEIYKDGIWSPGTAPAPDTLTPVANTYTLVCSKYKTVQFAKMTLGVTNTLSITGALAGMRGVIYVKQDAAGSRFMTLPSVSAKAASFALSTAPNNIDRLTWDYDGSNYFWTITNGITLPAGDSDAVAFLNNSGNSGDAAITSAIDNLVIAMKSSGTSPNTLWERTYRFWPYVGGTAAKHNYELKSGNSLGTFSGTGIAHTTDGIIGNGVTGVFNSGFVASASAARDSIGIYVYNKTASPTDTGFPAFFGSVGSGAVRLGLNRDGANVISQGPNDTTNVSLTIAIASSNFQGILYQDRSGASATKTGKIGDSGQQTGSVTSTGNCDYAIRFLARGYTGFPDDSFMAANLGAALITQSLSDAQRTALKTIIDNFETALGRAN